MGVNINETWQDRATTLIYRGIIFRALCRIARIADYLILHQYSTMFVYRIVYRRYHAPLK